jgi:hypothetical protein
MNNFPWPVITNNPASSDYVGAIINLQKQISIEASADGMSVSWDPSTGSEFINQMLAQGLACWVVEFNCPKTLFMRRIKVLYKDKLNQALSFDEVRGEVYMSVYIQCETNIDGFRPTGVSSDLASLDFSLRSGDIIGFARMKVFADPEYLMAPGMKSIFKIRPAGTNEGNASYQCSNDGEYFTIVLSKVLYEQFHRARMSANAAGKKAASGLIVLPPLVLLIKELAILGPECADLTMAQRRLFDLLDQHGIGDLRNSQPLEVALKLLEKNQVLATCFERIG